MIVPIAEQGGIYTRAGLDLQEHFGDHTLRPLTMDQKPKGLTDIGPHNRHHPILAWQSCADEGSASSIESLPGGDMVYPASEVNLPMFQKLRGGGVHISDSSTLSEEEDVPDAVQDGSSMAHSKRRMLAGHPLVHSSVVVSTDEVAADEMSTQSEDYTCHRVKFLCSYGGRILPRPSDGQLRYVGGDTRLITVNRDIRYSELMHKVTDVYSQVHTIKYKLPEEDLDALVSVSSDEDLANMMEEYDKLVGSDRSSRLRLFLFSGVDYDSGHHNDSLGDQRNSAQQYVDAVNGISETGSRKHSEGGLAPLMVENLIDVGDPWTSGRSRDSVPVAILAPLISQDVASLIQHVPVALPVSSVPLAVSSIQSKPNVASAPSSAPSSPPLLPRGSKQGMLPELHLQFFQDQHPKMSGHPYFLQSDGLYQDMESYGGNISSGANMHEHLYRNSDLQRGPESPTKMQHEGLLVGGHQEDVPRDDLRLLAEVRIPRVPSHGKLTRLSDHHLEGASSARQRHNYQQPQQQGGWPPHLLEVQMDGYNRRVDLFQPNSDLVSQPAVPGQYQQLVHFRSPFQSTGPPPPTEPVYWPVDHQSQGEEVFAPFMHRSVSAHIAGPPLGCAAASSCTVGGGSAPTSPRVAYRDSSVRHPAGQSLSQQAHRAYTGSNYAEQQQQHGRRHHPHSDSSNRLRPSTSPPRYRDHLGNPDDRLLRPHQEQALGTADPLQQEQFLYDANATPHGPYADGVARAQLPLYLGHNPFQEGLSGYSEHGYSEHQDGGDGRRHLFLGKEKISQQPFHPPHFNARAEYQDYTLPSAEPLPVLSRFQEQPSDWGMHQRGRDVEETRSRLAGRGRPGHSEYGDEDVSVELGATLHLEAQSGSYPHLPEDSDALLAPVVTDSHLYRKCEWVEPPETSNHQLRSTIPQSSALPVYASTLGRAVNDGSQAPPYVGKATETDVFTAPATRTGENLPSVTNPNTSAGQRLRDDRVATVALSHLAPHLSSYARSMRMANAESINPAELRWGGLTDSDDTRVEGLLHARDRASNQDRLQQLSGVGGQLSRPSIVTNMAALEQDALQGLQTSSITTQDNGTLAEEDIVSTGYGLDNLVFTDGPPAPSAQFLMSTGQPQALLPMSSGMTSFTVPTSSTKVSTRLSMFSTSGNGGTSAGTSMPEQMATSLGSMLFKPAVPAPRMSSTDGGSGGSLGRNADPGKKENIASLSQLSATGHLVEDMVSSVLGSSTKEALAPVQARNNMQEEEKGEWLQVSQDATTMNQAPLISSPTFALQNWERNLAALDAEEEDEEDRAAARDSIAEEKVSVVERPATEVLEEPETLVPAIEEPIADMAGSDKEDPKESNSNPVTASEAEAEAISRGLQTIRNVDLEEMRELGSGTFGTVYHGKWRGTDVAIKRIKASCFAGRPSERDRLIADFWKEACTLGQLHHPNVVAFYGLVRDGPGGTLATVTEYMVNGSLKQVLQKKDRTIDRRKRLLIAMDAAFGMEYLHSKSIVHFDLKCDNLLVNMRDPHRPICKVGDLGLSKVKHQTMVSGGVRGTLPWMAPELLNGSSSMVTEKVDVFSFGIVMWELLTGEEPYSNMHYGAIIGGIVNNTLRPQIPTWCDPIWKSLMERCWSAEPSLRPSFSEIASELRSMASALHPKAHEGK